MAQQFSTAQDMIDRIREEVEDPNAENYGDEELLGYINEAVDWLWKEITARAPWYFDSANITKEQAIAITPTVATYALPVDFFKERHLDVNGEESYTLKIVQKSDTDAEGHYYYAGNTELTPTPTAAGTATLYYIPAPDIAENVATAVPLQADFGQLIKNYGVEKAKSRNVENIGGTEMFRRLIENGVSSFLLTRNMPYDRGRKIRWYEWI